MILGFSIARLKCWLAHRRHWVKVRRHVDRKNRPRQCKLCGEWWF